MIILILRLFRRQKIRRSYRLAVRMRMAVPGSLFPTRHGPPPPFTTLIFLPPIFLPLEAKWGQAQSSEPIQIRSPDLRYLNRCNIGCRIDAPGDGRAPGAIAFSTAVAPPPQSFSPHFSASHFSAFPGCQIVCALLPRTALPKKEAGLGAAT